MDDKEAASHLLTTIGIVLSMGVTDETMDKAIGIIRSSFYAIREDEWKPLLDLLAIIHRDGGQHTAEVGLAQSVKDAKREIYAIREDERRKYVKALGDMIGYATAHQGCLIEQGSVFCTTINEDIDAARAVLAMLDEEAHDD